MGYRIGIDMGTNSIGWCVLAIEKGRPAAIRDIGVRIFSDGRDPQSGESLTQERREKRGQRRRRDRLLTRKRDLMKRLVEHGLMPADEGERKALEGLDPLALRAAALDGKCDIHHIGRALFHLHQRRGFRSNLKEDRKDNAGEREANKIDQGSARLEEEMKKVGARTLGEYLCKRLAEGKSTRARPVLKNGSVEEYPIYPTRKLVEAEFDAIWENQKKHHPKTMHDKARQAIHDAIFRQRSFAQGDVMVGFCMLDPSRQEKRLARAYPLFQRFRILQDLAHIRIRDPQHRERRLTLEERDRLYAILNRQGSCSYGTIRKTLGLSKEHTFNFERDPKRKKGLVGNSTALIMRGEKVFGRQWDEFSPEVRDGIVRALLDEDIRPDDPCRRGVEDTQFIAQRLDQACGIGIEGARAIVEAFPFAKLEHAHGHLGKTALGKIAEKMEHAKEYIDDDGVVHKAPLVYAHAARAAGYHHSDLGPKDLEARLPYYGKALQRTMAVGHKRRNANETRYGVVNNPTVHIALNQLRRVINGVMGRYGPPESVVVELSREIKQNRDQKKETKAQQTKNQEANENRENILDDYGAENNYGNRLKLRLWEELADSPNERCCPYSGGNAINVKELLKGNTIQIDHILPRNRTGDDSPSNKILCRREANQYKRGRSPYEAFGQSRDGYDWEGILSRSKKLPKNKHWRFSPEAMERFEDEEKFLDRQLTDNQYLSRYAVWYLKHVCGDVWSVNGRLTERLRHFWGLNTLLGDHNRPGNQDKKKREDHRHHSIDACVIALTDRGLVQKIHTENGKAASVEGGWNIDGETEKEIFRRAVGREPWSGFRHQLAERLTSVVVSHRADHGAEGALHEETAYGRTEEGDCVTRKPIEELMSVKRIASVRDSELRQTLQAAWEQAKREGHAAKDMPAEAFGIWQSQWQAQHDKNGRPVPIPRRARVLVKDESAIRVEHAKHRPKPFYKYYSAGQNHHIDLYEKSDGKWTGVGVSMYEARREGTAVREGEGRFIMRLHKRDLIHCERDGESHILRVAELWPGNRCVVLVGQSQGGNFPKRHNDPEDPFRWIFSTYNSLRKWKARRLYVDPLGRWHPIAHGTVGVGK